MSTPPYVELHAHSAFSFLDGASTPLELACAAEAHGYSALALTDHDGVWGSREFAESCLDLDLRPLTGAELTVNLATADGPKTADMGGFRPIGTGRREPELVHLTLLVESRAGYRNLCRLLTAAHAHTRDNTPRTAEAAVGDAWSSSRPTPRGSSASPAAPATAPSPAPGSAATPPAASGSAAACSRPSAPSASGSSCSAPSGATTAPATAGSKLLAARLGVATVATGNVHSHARRRAHLQDALVAVGRNETLEESEPHRRGNASSVLASPAAMAARFAEHPEAVRRDAAPRRAARVRPARPSSATATREAEDADFVLAELCRVRLLERYAGRPRLGRRRRAPARGAGDDPPPRPLRLLPPPPRAARAGPRRRRRGPRRLRRPPPAAAGPRPRLQRQLDRLLPDRPLPHRPGQGQPLLRPLPQRGRRPRCRTSTSTSPATSARS